MLECNIGGEFDFNHNLLIDSSLDRGGYSSGRSAFFYILLDVRERFHISTIMLPDYLCSSILTAVQKAGFKYEFYSLTEELKLDEGYFLSNYDDKKAVLVINYFGLQSIEKECKYIRSLNPNSIIIEDDVQAYYEYIHDSAYIDYKFTSLRKTFASPDGGFVKTKYNISQPIKMNSFYQYKVASGVLKEYRNKGFYSDEVYLNLSRHGEELIDNEIEDGISDVAYSVLANTDFGRVSNIRKQNAKYLASGLEDLNIKTIVNFAEDKTPLFIPIWLDDRNKVRKAMFQQNVFCPVHWPLDGMSVKKGAEMAEHELSLIIDQRYSTKDMERILDILQENI